MYLSKVHIAPNKVRNIYELHRALWELFPDRKDESRSFLFRAESICLNNGAKVLMQSMHQPCNANKNATIIASKTINYSFIAKQQFKFCLRSNPVKRIVDRENETTNKSIRSIRVPLIKEEEQQQWLTNKFQDACILNVVNIIKEKPIYFYKQKEKRSGKVQPIMYTGILTVKAPELLLQLIAKGIGPAKSFGMGLLSLA
jgi:CRISPR system Cascade subunit CasE